MAVVTPAATISSQVPASRPVCVDPATAPITAAGAENSAWIGQTTTLTTATSRARIQPPALRRRHTSNVTNATPNGMPSENA